MKRVMFVDNVSPRAYTPKDVFSGGLGGSEMAVVRTASRLAKEGYSVHVSQAGWEGSELTFDNVTYSGEMTLPDTVIVMRNYGEAIRVRNIYPNARIWVWAHDLAHPSMLPYLDHMVKSRIGVIAVSDFHKTNLIEMMKLANLREFPRVRRIHNMVDDNLKPDNTAVDPHKLVFISSPHKGLKYTLEIFERLQRAHPEYRLYITNPGYYPNLETSVPNVVNLENLPQVEAMKHVREALCVFYLNNIYPETFGMVLAEANAVGTPVLTHGLGAAREVLGDSRQIIDTRNWEAVIERILQWTKDRPVVTLKEEFRESNVIKKWKEIL